MSRPAVSPALSALLAAIHDRRATLPEPIVSLAHIVEREVAPARDYRASTYRPAWSAPAVDPDDPRHDPDDDHPLEWGLR